MATREVEVREFLGGSPLSGPEAQTIELVKQHCGRYLTSYSNCIDQFPDTWHLDCESQKLKLATCSQEHPTIKTIKMQCRDEFSVYNTCAKNNPLHLDKCSTEFMKFTECANKFVNLSKIVL
ncbi:hypothetical protein ScPMuIL_010776 [Solemya velum]